MSDAIDFEELDFRLTPIGELSLRRRAEPLLNDKTVYEVKLGDEFLMSSLFTESEVALADLALARAPWPEMDVAVGGLGLGYTAAAALAYPAVRSLLVIDALEAVIDWHRKALVPNGAQLSADCRCAFLAANFFELLRGPSPCLDRANPSRRYHAILVDIDHSPAHLLSSANADFYTPTGLTTLSEQLHPGGVFGLWSNDPPDDAFSRTLEQAFARAEAKVVSFDNPYSGGTSACTVYLGWREG